MKSSKGHRWIGQIESQPSTRSQTHHTFFLRKNVYKEGSLQTHKLQPPSTPKLPQLPSSPLPEWPPTSLSYSSSSSSPSPSSPPPTGISSPRTPTPSGKSLNTLESTVNPPATRPESHARGVSHAIHRRRFESPESFSELNDSTGSYPRLSGGCLSSESSLSPTTFSSMRSHPR